MKMNGGGGNKRNQPLNFDDLLFNFKQTNQQLSMVLFKKTCRYNQQLGGRYLNTTPKTSKGATLHKEI